MKIINASQQEKLTGDFKMDVSMKTQINASAADVWAVIGDFNALPKFVAAAVESKIEGEGLGAVRVITLPDGAILKERLEAYDGEGMVLKYSLAEGPLPVENYLASMAVTPTEDGCEFEWSSRFDANGVSDEEARAAISGVYDLGAAGLAKMFG